jgi:hypothetical protein
MAPKRRANGGKLLPCTGKSQWCLAERAAAARPDPPATGYVARSMRSALVAVSERATVRRATLALAAVILLGAVLRLIWPSDMEYKGDERFLFLHATGSDPFPWLGQRSGVGTRNPGMGIWVYSLMARGFGLNTPVGLDRGVMVLNIIALIGLAVFALRMIPSDRREPWLWATALVAVNPLAVLFSRKLWIQSVLPPFVVVMLVGWWRRGARGGAFAWGLVGAWLGQIHMTGFFFAGGFAAWTALRDHRSTRWRWWLAGSVVGALTLLPWLANTLAHPGTPMRSWSNLWPPQFWVFSVSNPLGLSLLRLPVVGSTQGFSDHLLAWPTFHGTALHLVEIAVIVISATAVAIAVIGLAFAVWPRIRHPRWPRAGRASETGLATAACLLAFGLLITASGVLIYRHYLIVAFVLPFVVVAGAALLRPHWGRPLLAVLVIAQAALSILYLDYVHVRGAAVGGDYGVPYDHQAHGRHPARG